MATASRSIHKSWAAARTTRFITSPELAPYAGAGAAIGSTGLMGTTNVDVYPFIVVGEMHRANWRCAARVPSIRPTSRQGRRTKAIRWANGYIGAKFYMQCTLLNEVGWYR